MGWWCGGDVRCNGPVLVLHRFRVPVADAAPFRAEVEEALEILSARPGFQGSTVGRNVDDPELWVLETRWTGPGDYRRALSAYDVKVRAWALLARAVDEPSAYELVEGDGPLNDVRPRDHTAGRDDLPGR